MAETIPIALLRCLRANGSVSTVVVIWASEYRRKRLLEGPESDARYATNDARVEPKISAIQVELTDRSSPSPD